MSDHLFEYKLNEEIKWITRQLDMELIRTSDRELYIEKLHILVEQRNRVRKAFGNGEDNTDKKETTD